MISPSLCGQLRSLKLMAQKNYKYYRPELQLVYKAGLRWLNTVFALSLMQFSTCTRVSKNKHHFIYSTPALTVLFFSITERSVLMALVFYYKDMLEKVAMQRTQQFSAFVCYRKKPVKCNECAVARKIEADCFSRNVPISNDPVVRILRNFAKK